MKTAVRAGMVFSLAVLSASALAAHVTDKLAVGLYESAQAEQPLQLLTSGTPVERLELSGLRCKVRLGSGEEGWLECRYLTDEKPARAMLLEAQAGSAGLRRELDEVRGQLQAQRLETVQLGRRLQAAERLLGGELPEQAVEPPEVRGEPEPAVPGGGEPFQWNELLPGLFGLLVGLLLGGALFYWRCRRRYGGLRI